MWSPTVSPTTLVLTVARPDAGRIRSIPLDTATWVITRPRGRAAIFRDTRGMHYLWAEKPEAFDHPQASFPFDDVLHLRAAAWGRLAGRLSGTNPPALPRVLQLSPFQTTKLIQRLHVLDFHLVGTKPRDIASRILDSNIAHLPAIEWKSSAARRQIMRLLAEAEVLMNGGYRSLLRGF